MAKFQGFRPWAYGDVWDRMSPQQRRFAFWTDIAVALAGAALLYGLASWLVP
jgi:hypothetical protein